MSTAPGSVPGGISRFGCPFHFRCSGQLIAKQSGIHSVRPPDLPARVEHMRLLKEFSQSEGLERYKSLTGEDSLGICMRLAFKWVALGMVGGRFKYENYNVAKISNKMDSYGRQAIGMLQSAQFRGNQRFYASQYVVTDLLTVKQYINLWGREFTDADKVKFYNVRCVEAVRAPLPQYFSRWRTAAVKLSEMGLIITFYMLFDKSFVQEMLPKIPFAGSSTRKVMAGHAVGFLGNNMTFFDPNWGVYSVEAEASNYTKAAQEIELFLKSKYPLTGNPLDRGVFRLGFG
jgi:hypothetical protein